MAALFTFGGACLASPELRAGLASLITRDWGSFTTVRPSETAASAGEKRSYLSRKIVGSASRKR